jgi:hypothetical protein
MAEKQRYENRPQTPPNVKVGETRERVGSTNKEGVSWPCFTEHPDLSKVKKG